MSENGNVADDFGSSDLGAARHAYRVLKIALSDADQIEGELNKSAAEGWRLKSVIPDSAAIHIVLESAETEPLEDEPDESMDGDPVSAISNGMFGAGGIDLTKLMTVSHVVKPESSYRSEFDAFIAGLGLKYFSPEEFLVLGGSHYSGKCKNGLPPKSLWDNISATAKVLDNLRDKLGSSIQTLSVYRTPSYNKCIGGGATNSMHMQFNAIDFKCSDGLGSVHWAKTLKGMRDAGQFKGAIGVYPTFVHLDTRGYNANFGPWESKVF